jgi:hypothetical protein
MLTSRHAAVGGLLAFLFASAQLHAQLPAEKLLASIKNLKCTFSVSATGTWEKGEAQARLRMGPVLSFSYSEIDAAGSTANVAGLASSGHVVVQLMGANMHFLEMRNTGSLMLTTVFGQESKNKRLKAIYTRADFLPIAVPGFENTPEVSQHYGECEILP